MKLILILISLVVMGCAKEQSAIHTENNCVPTGDFSDALVSASRPGIEKQGKFGTCIAETTPIVFKGQLLAITYHSGFVYVYDFKTQELISKHWGAGQFGSALVVNDKLYYFSSHSPDIKIMVTEDLYTWSYPETIFTIDGVESTQVWNTSVTVSPNGFTMAYEVSEPDIDGYTWRIAQSPDLKTWTKIGERFDSKYSACPTVRYIDGQYYFTYLAYQNGAFVTRVARTTDFKNYDNSETIFLAPSQGEGKNASDVDFVEYDNQVYLVYLDGNQAGWDDQRWATFDGTMQELFEGMF